MGHGLAWSRRNVRSGPFDLHEALVSAVFAMTRPEWHPGESMSFSRPSLCLRISIAPGGALHPFLRLHHDGSANDESRDLQVVVVERPCGREQMREAAWAVMNPRIPESVGCASGAVFNAVGVGGTGAAFAGRR